MTETDTPPMAGRKPKDPKQKRYWDSELHAFLLPYFKEVPDLVRDERINVKKIARSAEVSKFTVYRWLNGYLTTRGARALIEMTVSEKNKDGLLEMKDLAEYLV